jgi:hypothetical protein
LIVTLTLEPALTQFNCLPRGLMLVCLTLLGTITLKTHLSHALGNKDDVSTTLIFLLYDKENWMNYFIPKIAFFQDMMPGTYLSYHKVSHPRRL